MLKEQDPWLGQELITEKIESKQGTWAEKWGGGGMICIGHGSRSVGGDKEGAKRMGEAESYTASARQFNERDRQR